MQLPRCAGRRNADHQASTVASGILFMNVVPAAEYGVWKCLEVCAHGILSSPLNFVYPGAHGERAFKCSPIGSRFRVTAPQTGFELPINV